MPKRSNPFQKLIALVNQQLAGHAEVVESAFLSDSITGKPREVDVLIKESIAGYDTRLCFSFIEAMALSLAPVNKVNATRARLRLSISVSVGILLITYLICSMVGAF